MKKRILTVIGIFVVIGVLGYAALTVYANNAQRAPSLPPVDKARYEFIVKNTGTHILTNKYDQKGAGYILHGYYELSGGKWIYRTMDLPLDPKVWGTVTRIERRVKQ